MIYESRRHIRKDLDGPLLIILLQEHLHAGYENCSYLVNIYQHSGKFRDRECVSYKRTGLLLTLDFKAASIIKC